tara:strand:+ start:11041 stop:11220 length:180 start_codon:yes stop_codon:yes gene_type:complete
MSIIKLAISSAFVTGALTAGAFISGILIGSLSKNKDILSNIKKMSLKKNNAASSKNIDK